MQRPPPGEGGVAPIMRPVPLCSGCCGRTPRQSFQARRYSRHPDGSVLHWQGHGRHFKLRIMMKSDTEESGKIRRTTSPRENRSCRKAARTPSTGPAPGPIGPVRPPLAPGRDHRAGRDRDRDRDGPGSLRVGLGRSVNHGPEYPTGGGIPTAI